MMDREKLGRIVESASTKHWFGTGVGVPSWETMSEDEREACRVCGEAVAEALRAEFADDLDVARMVAERCHRRASNHYRDPQHQRDAATIATWSAPSDEPRCEWCDPSFGCFDGSAPCCKGVSHDQD